MHKNIGDDPVIFTGNLLFRTWLFGWTWTPCLGILIVNVRFFQLLMKMRPPVKVVQCPVILEVYKKYIV